MRAEHLYIHVPFCSRRCVYCDFSIAVRTRVPVSEYVSALSAELDLRHRDSELDLRTLYLGGGTPSKLGADGVARVIDVIDRRAQRGPDTEVTLEANPEDVSAASVRAWRATGVNRLSLGVQSFHAPTLEWMHRTHSVADAMRAIDVARAGGIENISIDLIFATPSEAEGRSWERDLTTALELRVPHVSVYGLTVEPHTPLGRWVARQQVLENPEESFEQDFLTAHDLLTQGGLEHYEVSNYGRASQHSLHNLAYWRRVPYAGLGPSAHEFDGRRRSWNTSAYAHWLDRLSSGADPTEELETLDEAQLEAEVVYLGLRTNRGLALSSAECEHVQPWITAGWAELVGNTIHLTAHGWLRVDSIASDLTHFRSHY